MKILLVEDEKQIAKPLAKGLTKRNYQVDWEDNGVSAYQSAVVNSYDCIVLDLNLPGMDGLEIATKLREEEINTPILMLTARTTQENIWEGFEAGTDDYLAKPFDFKELLFRIESLIRRNSKNTSKSLVKDNIRLDPETFSVELNKSRVDLNGKEFGILE